MRCLIHCHWISPSYRTLTIPIKKSHVLLQIIQEEINSLNWQVQTFCDLLRRDWCINLRKLKNHINEWLDNVGLSDERIKAKISEGFKAKETKFFAHQGEIVSEREVEALDIQRKYVEMAAKVKGLFAPEKFEGSLTLIAPEKVDKQLPEV